MKNSIFENIDKIKGIGPKIKKKFEEKNIFNKIDLLLNLPIGSIDRRFCPKLDQLEVGKISTIFVKGIRYQFPRIRNLPNKVICEDQFGKIDIVFFNSRESYIKQIIPLNQEVVISGKVNLYKNKYQITNPDYVQLVESNFDIKKIMAKYSNITGVSEKTLQKIYINESSNIEKIDEWHDQRFLEKMSWLNWNESLKRLHNPENINDIDKNSIYFERLAFDEIYSNLIIFNEIKKRLKKITKVPKKINEEIVLKILQSLNFTLTDDQKEVLAVIKKDLSSDKKMLRVLQGDVGSGKTIVSLISAAMIISNNNQVALMVPTEILANQHYNLIKKILHFSKIKVDLLTSKLTMKEQNSLKKKIEDGETNFIIGTHSLFQDKIKFKQLDYIIIDEQHKFGVQQRINLSTKGNDGTDVLLMSATPIPRTLILTKYGDMDISTIKNKPFKNKTLTILKPENKLDEVISFIKKKIEIGDQVYWVCPIIEESEILKVNSVTKRFDYLLKNLNVEINFIHGQLSKEEKDKIMSNFINNKTKILLSTTIIEVGIDNPNANTMVIENSERFGLSQLHQLRGRIGRSGKEAHCILLYSNNISETGKKRIKIMKESNDGFYISEEDLKLRGFGDIIGTKQSGEKDFTIADPLYHQHLFEIAQSEIETNKQFNISRYELLLKIFKKDQILNIIDTG